MASEKSQWAKFFYSKWFFIIIIILIILVIFAFLRSYYQDYQVRQEIQYLKDEAERLEAKKIQSLEILKYVQSKNFVEDKARTDFNMAKLGEQEAIITSPQQAVEKDGQAENKVLEWKGISNPIKWWKLFFNK
ncbi:MAG: hypothetical protein COU29_04395 [Candidatus Magasanikbacteria bacterium CG10_big_fil_rev_8_21_14_0_10_36_32]|uniref:Septum formation initiator n=1 Tax=Candidatus Magasanikbacteria bacterium CG10_big_fil_rev_8_21_14_0_10_36_32 TaxID=1974646 RepID=A0A2M6W5E9_9BACT|nr:MAG: hypothetical protein COU29_04395 [Candidatus Magasanikbacteria bacterium CG10_big_fil_rev_8_21_14_0_10_36_32]